MQKKKGFSLIELLIVVAIILIIAAIAIPNLLRSRMAANEASAVGTLRSLVSAESTYQIQNPTIGYSADLPTLGTLLGSIPSNCKKNGYTCAYAPVTGTTPVSQYTAVNDPDTTSTGIRSFFVNEVGAIHAKTGAGATATDPLLQ
jgi:prepilin-type N-terminal cleavage/methylation domain-containing protein